MARRTSERVSLASSSSADDGVDDEGAPRESWLCRSTVCASEDEEDIGTQACGWSKLHTPTPFNLEPAQTRDQSGDGDGEEKGAEAATSRIRTGKHRLPLLSGFSSAEALRPQLPRVANKQAQITLRDAASKEKGLHKTHANVEKPARAASSDDFTPSTVEIEANRRKWDLERKLQDADRGFNAVGTVGVAEQKSDHARKLQPVNNLVPSTAEVEANQRKWDLERRLQDTDRSGASVQAGNGPDRRRNLKRKLQTLNPFARKLNPVVPSAAEADANQRKWDLERRLQDGYQRGVSGGKRRANHDSMKKLPALNLFSTVPTPAAPSASEEEANRQKWDLERRLQDADRANVPAALSDVPDRKRGLGRNLHNLNPFAVNPVTPSAAEVEANRRKWDLERRLQDEDRAKMSVNGVHEAEQKAKSTWKLPSLTPAAPSVPQNVDLEGKLCLTESGLELECQAGKTDTIQKKESAVVSSPSGSHQEQRSFEMNETLVYVLLFGSTAVLHSAIFNFSLELRQFLRLDMYPFGVLLLLSWTFVGLIHFVGGLVGDLVRDRVVLLRRAAGLWTVAVVALHVAAFKTSAVVSSICLVLGLLCAGVAHGIVCPNAVALVVERTLCNFNTSLTPLSPEDDEESNSSSSEKESEAESEASYLSDVSTVVSDVEQQGSDLASHNFFSGCFAARLAGSSLVQGYYFLLVDVDMSFTDEASQSTASSRGFHFMVLISFGLMASLLYFCFQSWDHRPNPVNASPRERTDEQRLERKLALLERGFSSAEALWTWSWRNLVQLCNRALVGYALLAFVLMTLTGVGFSLVVVLVASQTSLSVRLSAFLLIVTGWLLTMVASSRQLNPTKKRLLRECRRLGLRSRQLYLVLFAAAFICISGCVSFLRAQLFTTMVVQVCQTRLLIPGTTNTLFVPDIVGTAAGTSSLVLLGLSRVLSRSSPANEIVSPSTAEPTKTHIFAPTTPVLQKAQKHSMTLRLLPPIVSCPPVTRMCFAMLLYLISVFLSSVVELYRRKEEVSPSLLPRSCGTVHSEFSFLWTSPYMVLLGVSDALFRISLQEACHNLAQGSFASTQSSLKPRRWAGTVQGCIALAEALGYTTALSLVAVLSRWLFRPEPTDMALLFLLLTTVVALTHAMLKHIATRTRAFQRVYFPARCRSTSSEVAEESTRR